MASASAHSDDKNENDVTYTLSTVLHLPGTLLFALLPSKTNLDMPNPFGGLEHFCLEVLNDSLADTGALLFML